MKLLIDADYIVYKTCAGVEVDIDFGNDVIVVVSKFSEAMKAVEREIAKILRYFDADKDQCILFFSSANNFRKKILPDYKGHRNRKKPCGYLKVITELGNLYDVRRVDGLEADDLMGIYATDHPESIIVSPDKDMQQIPCRNLWNLKDDPIEIKLEAGRRWHLIQTLAGDQTDGYAGCPGIGIKRAVTIFESEGYTWEAVVATFEEKGLTEDEALINARLAKILTTQWYDKRTKRPILWLPEAIASDNTGADSRSTAEATSV